MTMPDEENYFDPSDGIKVNVSSKEVSAGPREALPAGAYLVAITDTSLAESKSQKNNGKPYMNVEFTIQDGEHEGKKLFTNAMLFDGALYTVIGMMKAVGLDVNEGELTIPNPEWWLGKKMVATAKKKHAQQKVEGSDPVKYELAWEDPDTRKKPVWTNEISSFKSAKEWKGAPSAEAKTNSLLPS